MSRETELSEKVASLEQQLIDIKQCMHDMNIQRTFAVLRADNTEDEMALVRKENVDLIATFDDFTDQVNTLKQEKNIQSVKIITLENEKVGLQNIIKDYENKLYKRGQSEQTIHMNQPKEFKSYNDKEGLGFVSPHCLSKAIQFMPTLYDQQYMRYGLTQNFIRVSDEEREIEEFKRSRTDKSQISFDYENLNDSYNTSKSTFSYDYFPSYSQEELNQTQNGSNVVLEQVIFKKPYIPTLVLEKRIADLESDLKHKNVVLQMTKKEFEEKIEKLKNVSASSKSKVDKLPSHILITPKSKLVKKGKICEGICGANQIKTESTLSVSKKASRIPSFNKHNSLQDQIENKIAKIEKRLGPMKNLNQEAISHISAKAKSNVIVSGKIYTGNSFKPFSKKVSQFTNYSLQKDKKYSKKPQSSGTFTCPKSSSNNLTYCLQKDKQVWRPKVTLSKKSTKSFKYSFSKLFELAPRNVRLGVQKLNDFVQKSPPVFKSPLIPRDLFQAKTSSVKSQWNSTSLHHIDTTYKWFAKVSKTIGPVLRWVPKVVLK